MGLYLRYCHGTVVDVDFGEDWIDGVNSNLAMAVRRCDVVLMVFRRITVWVI